MRKGKGNSSKFVIKGKKSYPSRYGDGLAKEDKVIIKEKANYPSRYK